MSKLVIVESPAKAKTISKILGKGYVVKSSVGHIRDLPERKLGVDVKKDFETVYVIAAKKKKLVEELRKAAKNADAICLAPDPDREGEAIAWHLQEVLSTVADPEKFERVQYNEITPRAVKAAFEHPGKINMDRVNAQQARRVLDRLVGYQVSPMLWRNVRRGASAGRVQSVALRLVCERERQILDFKPEAYWVMGAKLSKKGETFTAKLAKIDGEKPVIKDENAAQTHLANLDGRALEVSDVRLSEVSRRPFAPFITSTLQQAASSFCGFSPSRTMSIAQRLYEGIEIDGSPVGLITYMRTDSVTISQEAREEAKKFILGQFGDEFYPAKPNFYANRSGAQEAHEAIRPTDVTLTPEKLKKLLEPSELKLYDLIWRRFVASQMTPARIARRTVEIASVPPPMQKHSYLFTATASDIAFPGFLKVMALDLTKSKKPPSDANDDQEEETDEVERLPELAAKDSLNLEEWICDRKETNPPSRYSEASLIKALEADGVGRPSTYASIIETLDTRKYITRVKRQIKPTDFGFQVNDLLVSKLPSLFNVSFTAQMEEKLDKVEAGEVAWTEMLGKFYTAFEKWMEQTKAPPADGEQVRILLALLGQVKHWREPVKIGRRAIDDQRFITSIENQYQEGAGSITERQLDSLIKIAMRYREQLPTLKLEFTRAGLAEKLHQEEASQAAPDIALKRFAVLERLTLPDESHQFITSVKAQAHFGHKVSEAQLKVLDRLIMRNIQQLPDAQAVLAELGLDPAAQTPGESEPDNESAEMIAALDQVKEWAEPFKRGRMTYDDNAFFKSLSQQFQQRSHLSIKQRMVLKRLMTKYAKQIPNFNDLADRFKIAPPKDGAGE